MSMIGSARLFSFKIKLIYYPDDGHNISSRFQLSLAWLLIDFRWIGGWIDLEVIFGSVKCQ